MIQLGKQASRRAECGRGGLRKRGEGAEGQNAPSTQLLPPGGLRKPVGQSLPHQPAQHYFHCLFRRTFPPCFGCRPCGLAPSFQRNKRRRGRDNESLLAPMRRFVLVYLGILTTYDL